MQHRRAAVQPAIMSSAVALMGGGVAGFDDTATGMGRATLEAQADDPSASGGGGVLVAQEPPADDVLVEELLVEEISIDGMCGVY